MPPLTSAGEKEPGLGRVTPIPGQMDGRASRHATLQTSFDAREIPDSEDELSPLESPLEISPPATANIGTLKTVPQVFKPAISPVAARVSPITLMPERVHSEQVLDQAVSNDAKTRQNIRGEIADTDSEGEDVRMDGTTAANGSRDSEESQNGNTTTVTITTTEDVKRPLDSSACAATGTEKSASEIVQRTGKSAISDHIDSDGEQPLTNPVVITKSAPTANASHTQQEYTSDGAVLLPSETSPTSAEASQLSSAFERTVTENDAPTEPIETKPTNTEPQFLTPEQKKLVSLLV
jgi:hypothetical protein